MHFSALINLVYTNVKFIDIIRISTYLCYSQCYMCDVCVVFDWIVNKITFFLYIQVVFVYLLLNLKITIISEPIILYYEDDV